MRSTRSSSPSEELGDTERFVTNAVLVFMWSLTIFCSISDTLPLYVVMDILYIKDVCDTDNIATNAVLVFV